MTFHAPIACVGYCEIVYTTYAEKSPKSDVIQIGLENMKTRVIVHTGPDVAVLFHAKKHFFLAHQGVTALKGPLAVYAC